MNLNKLRDKAYQCAVLHGWHEEKKSNRHWLCLVISELMEAVEADRKGRHANVNMYHEICRSYIPSIPKKNGFIFAYEETIKGTVEEELADACIRLFDYAGVTGYDLDDFDYNESDTDNYSEMTFTESMYNITNYIMEWDITVVLDEIFAFCRDRNIDIFWHIEQKMKYNELRPYKHGDKSY
jgi:hypothetical protein